LEEDDFKNLPKIVKEYFTAHPKKKCPEKI